MPWRSSLLEQFDWVTHATSTREDGSLRYPNPDETADPWKPARDAFVASLAFDPRRLVMSGNKHGRSVVYVSGRDHGRVDGVDGLVTDEPHVPLGVKTADCLPIFFVETETRTVGLIHAGWKGVAAGIPTEGAELMSGRGLYLETLYAAIGPSIGPCHYIVHKERRDEMLASHPLVSESDFRETSEGFHADLRTMAVRMLTTAGIPLENIDASAPCTACEPDKFFSYHLGRNKFDSMLSIISIK